MSRAATAMTACFLAACALCLAAPAAMALTPSYTTKRSAYRKHATFVVVYQGYGIWSTTYHATPPNPGGAPDTNDAHDASAQRWNLVFRQRVALDPCGPGKDGRPHACPGIQGPSDATGTTTATGSIDHTHVDGLYRELDAAVRCGVRADIPRGPSLPTSIGMSYSPRSRTIAVRAYNPVFTVLSLLPSQCPELPDGIDRIADNYFTPGFSFSSEYGADRWFTSRKVVIPATTFHHASRITIPLANTRTGTPPADCSVRDPSIERCSTAGSWMGTLVFKAP